MKKTYNQPQVEITFAEVTNMLAVSLHIINGSVDGNEALIKESSWESWDIWGDGKNL